MTVTQAQIDKAKAHSMVNVETAAAVCDEYRFPFFIFMAILEKETHGRNVYGHDAGGALAGFEKTVTKDNYAVFRWLVDVKGMKSNGVGPMQLTFTGFFSDMAKQALEPWRVRDNMAYGCQILKRDFTAAMAKPNSTVKKAILATAKAYNGNQSYADDALLKAQSWFELVGNSDRPAVAL